MKTRGQGHEAPTVRARLGTGSWVAISALNFRASPRPTLSHIPAGPGSRGAGSAHWFQARLWLLGAVRDRVPNGVAEGPQGFLWANIRHNKCPIHYPTSPLFRIAPEDPSIGPQWLHGLSICIVPRKMNEVIYFGDMEVSPRPVGKVKGLGILTIWELRCI